MAEIATTWSSKLTNSLQPASVVFAKGKGICVHHIVSNKQDKADVSAPTQRTGTIYQNGTKLKNKTGLAEAGGRRRARKQQVVHQEHTKKSAKQKDAEAPKLRHSEKR